MADTTQSTTATSTEGTSGTGGTTMVAKVQETASSFADEAASAARSAAHTGKEKASEALHGLSQAVENAAAMVEERVGPKYGAYARQAATSVAGVAQSLQEKDVEELVDDARTLIRQSPAVAFGIAAGIGFLLTRLIKVGSDAPHTYTDDR